MPQHNNSRVHGRGRNRLLVGLVLDVAPQGENEHVNEVIVESSMHEITQQAPVNISNIE